MLASRICLRTAHRPCAAPIVPIALSTATRIHSLRYARRVFATTPLHRKSDARIPVGQQDAAEAKHSPGELVKPESAKKEQPATPSHATILAEQAISKKEQRAIDWGIIKNMVQYIWPKDHFGTRFRVGLSVGLLIGAKVGHDPPLYAL